MFYKNLSVQKHMKMEILIFFYTKKKKDKIRKSLTLYRIYEHQVHQQQTFTSSPFILIKACSLCTLYKSTHTNKQYINIQKPSNFLVCIGGLFVTVYIT